MSEMRNRFQGRDSRAEAAPVDNDRQHEPMQESRRRRSSPRSRSQLRSRSSSRMLSSTILSALFLCILSSVIIYYYLSDRSSSQPFFSHDHPPTEPVSKKLKIPFEAGFSGGVVTVELDGLVRVCSSCKGSGAAPGSIQFCTACQGTGERITRTQIFAGGPLIHIRQQCSRCQGTGSIITKYCPACHGHRTTLIQQRVDVPIHAGARSGDTIRIEGQGNHIPDHSAGDLIFILEVPTDSGAYKRIGNDVTMTIPVKLREALLGFRKTLQHVDGENVVVDRSDVVTSPSTIVAIPGRGWHQSRDGQQPTGDLLVHFDIEYPNSLSSSDIDLLKRTLQ